MPVVRLPVSGLEVVLHAPSGADDLYLAEEPARDASVALELLRRVTRLESGGGVEWASLPLTDVDAALLALRRWLIGDVVRAALRCPADGCGALFDISFRISEYVEHHAPRRPRRVSRDAETGWYRLDETGVEFRLPSCEDLRAIGTGGGDTDVTASLATRCIRGGAPSAVARRRVEAAMQAIAPSLYGELWGECFECKRAVRTFFNPMAYVLEDLAQRAAGIYEDIHLLAHWYHWSEEAILALPRQR